MLRSILETPIDGRVILGATLVAAICASQYLMSCFRRRVSFDGKHVFITGGSLGIGYAVAADLARRGANLTIVARTQSKLDTAKSGLEELARSAGSSTRVLCCSTDVSDLSQVTQAVQRAEEAFGPVDYALCFAGAAYPGRFLEQEIGLFEKSMQLDYFGSLHVAKAVLPGMLKRRAGHLVFTASPLAAIGMVGYATYCPPKAAVRSLADCLRNELAGTGICISIGYPLDTDTPGFANENLSKPPETEAISRFAGGSVCTSEEIAKGLLRGIENGDYHIKTSDFLVNMLISSTGNITPKIYPGVVEACMAPVLIPILAIYRRIMDGFVIRQRTKEKAALSRASS